MKKLFLAATILFSLIPYLPATLGKGPFSRMSRMMSMAKSKQQSKASDNVTLTPCNSYILKSECDQKFLELTLSRQDATPYIKLMCEELKVPYDPTQLALVLKNTDYQDLQTVNDFLTYIHRQHINSPNATLDHEDAYLKHPHLLATLFNVFKKVEPKKIKLFLKNYQQRLHNRQFKRRSSEFFAVAALFAIAYLYVIYQFEPALRSFKNLPLILGAGFLICFNFLVASLLNIFDEIPLPKQIKELETLVSKLKNPNYGTLTDTADSVV